MMRRWSTEPRPHGTGTAVAIILVCMVLIGLAWWGWP